MLFIVAAALGQVISNTAKPLVIIPVAVAAANDLDVSVKPTPTSLNIVTVAALLTPTATAASTMIMRSGDRFGGYLKLGIPLLAWWFVISVGLGPVIWRL